MNNKRPHSCNVLDSSPAARHLWQFSLDRNEVKLDREETISIADPLTDKRAKLLQKDWRDLFQPRLNIGWIGADQVYLRVVQLPAVERQELLSMLEFQLEKLSPIPVAQVIWTAEVLPSAAEKMQTAIVCIVSRDVVESYLGSLEEAQFQPDRLEVPQLSQIVADGVRTDGAWIYPGTGSDADLCSVAWWANGTLQDLQLLRLPAVGGSITAVELSEQRALYLEEQLMQTAWAGELEGWLSLPVKWHLTATNDVAAQWRPLLERWTEGSLEVTPALSREALAQFSATRAARLENSANLLPSDFAAKYRQEYIDRLWMRGLGAVVVVYIICVAIYLAALQIFTFRQSRVQSQVASLANTYTNVLQLKERVQVLQEQLSLKYAALDCWKITAENLPADFSLTWLVFGRGRTLELHGNSPPGQEQQISDFNEGLRRATVDGQPLFKDVAPPITISRPGSPNVTWNFQCQLNIAEALQ